MHFRGLSPPKAAFLTSDHHADILKAHRVYHLFHEYGLFNVELSSPGLEEAFHDQLLVS